MTAVTPTPIGRLELPQYSLRQILAVWLAATIPMSILSWAIVPWLSDRIGGRDPFLDALLICFNIGLIWMIVMVLILVRREQGSLSWSHLRDALWLRAPRDPKSGRVGGRVWWWVLPFTLFTAVVNALPIDPIGPLPRDLPQAIRTDRVAEYFHGNWGGFALLTALLFLARSPRSWSSEDSCCRACEPSSVGGTSSQAASSSRSTTSTSRGACPPR
jgi:hypothetical protein